MMPRSLTDKMNSLLKERQEFIQTRANELIADEMTLRDLRLALKKTQEDLGETLLLSNQEKSRGVSFKSFLL